MRLSIAEAWKAYADKVLPAGVSSVQRDETRKAFYVGAYTLFEMMMSQLSPGDEPHATDLTLLDDLHSELERFLAETLKPGGRVT